MEKKAIEHFDTIGVSDTLKVYAKERVFITQAIESLYMLMDSADYSKHCSKGDIEAAIDEIMKISRKIEIEEEKFHAEIREILSGGIYHGENGNGKESD